MDALKEKKDKGIKLELVSQAMIYGGKQLNLEYNMDSGEVIIITRNGKLYGGYDADPHMPRVSCGKYISEYSNITLHRFCMLPSQYEIFAIFVATKKFEQDSLCFVYLDLSVDRANSLFLTPVVNSCAIDVKNVKLDQKNKILTIKGGCDSSVEKNKIYKFKLPYYLIGNDQFSIAELKIKEYALSRVVSEAIDCAAAQYVPSP